MAVGDDERPILDHGEAPPLRVSHGPGERSGTVSVSDVRPGGLAGLVADARSLLTGLGLTAGYARRSPVTLRYPAERYELSPRWRGALRLRGMLGRDDVEMLSTEPPSHNAAIEALYEADRLPPCVGNCPANVDARGQNHLAAESRFAEAYELVRERNVFPGVLGRICHHPCESACRRNYYDEPLAVRPLHRLVSEEFAEVRAERIRRLPVTREERVAVVGSGPSGLAAALDLMRLGYAVTAFEKDERPGGALQTGVPSYRLPREVLQTEIDDLVGMGLDLRCGIEVGPDVPMDHLMGEFDAVLLAVGLQDSRLLPLPGTDAKGVVGALEFLRAANHKGEAGVRGKRVMVIGGGNVAVDVARCAIRVGAKEVRLACLEGESEMPCHPWEIEEALDEGVIAMCSLGPEEVLAERGHVTGMRMRACLQVFDESGRFAPVFGDDRTDVPADVVVFAVGQAARLGALLEGSELLVNERGQLIVDGTLHTTTVPGVFACGEVVTGPGSAIGSIATGHEAATSVHRYLRGQDLAEGRVPRPVPKYAKYGKATLDGVEQFRLRCDMPMASPDLRRTDFRPVELGMTRQDGLTEAARCLRCQSDMCVGCTFCARVCPDHAIQVKRVDGPDVHVTRYDLDLTKCCFCGLCAEQCPTNALCHTGQYELTFFHRDLMTFGRSEMLRDGSGTRATGADAGGGGGAS